MTGKDILVVEDEEAIAEAVRARLVSEGYDVRVAHDGPQALRAAAEARPDLVVLDLMLPGMDGLSILRQVRHSSDVPVIILSARTEEVDRVVGLELGADDYVAKPCSPRELVARVRSVLRRGRTDTDVPSLEFDGLVIDARSRTVLVMGKLVPFRAREFDLLHFLASSRHQVFSRSQLLDRVWESSAEFCDVSTVTVHVRRIRQKIEADHLAPRWIQTVRGIGYRFDP